VEDGVSLYFSALNTSVWSTSVKFKDTDTAPWPCAFHWTTLRITHGERDWWTAVRRGDMTKRSAGDRRVDWGVNGAPSERGVTPELEMESRVTGCVYCTQRATPSQHRGTTSYSGKPLRDGGNQLARMFSKGCENMMFSKQRVYLLFNNFKYQQRVWQIRPNRKLIVWRDTALGQTEHIWFN